MVIGVSKHIFDIVVCVRGMKCFSGFGGLCRLSIPASVLSRPSAFGRNRLLCMVGTRGAVLPYLSDSSAHVDTLSTLIITVSLAVIGTTAVRAGGHARIGERRRWEFGC
ncbi:hypothetical protein DU484_18810 (plasmid) [Haloplanus rubicundus]|uniref:Uncharacterized protein n=1 Tax=Haloplanus rubicundus TaxID=1547898 RepID=A0A345EIE0_9EURY|nr:hypothetical protein DU484_18810 [Haloplanus rubicundus]